MCNSTHLQNPCIVLTGLIGSPQFRLSATTNIRPQFRLPSTINIRPRFRLSATINIRPGSDCQLQLTSAQVPQLTSDPGSDCQPQLINVGQQEGIAAIQSP